MYPLMALAPSISSDLLPWEPTYPWRRAGLFYWLPGNQGGNQIGTKMPKINFLGITHYLQPCWGTSLSFSQPSWAAAAFVQFAIHPLKGITRLKCATCLFSRLTPGFAFYVQSESRSALNHRIMLSFPNSCLSARPVHISQGCSSDHSFLWLWAKYL